MSSRTAHSWRRLVRSLYTVGSSVALGGALTVGAITGGTLSPVARAQTPATATDVVVGPEITVKLRDEYIAGEPLLVGISVSNGGSDPITTDDLSARPWLVVFQLKREGGQTQRRSTTPPERDPGTLVTIAPRGQRRTLLEVPSGRSLKPGRYTFTVLMRGQQVIATRSIQISPAHPVAGDVGTLSQAIGKQGVQALWLHQGLRGFDLYLHRAAGADPRRVLSDSFLTHIDHAIQPVLSEVLPGDQGGRYVVWAQGDRGIAWARLQSTELRDQVRVTDVPWPSIQLVGRPATDGSGLLQVPFWVPAPQGSGGDLRVMSVGGRNPPAFHRVAGMDRRPDDVRTLVDGAGAVEFLVTTQGNLDLYTLRSVADASPAPRGLPLAGRRLMSALPGERILGAAFGIVPQAGTDPGGRAILVMIAKDGALDARWLSLRGGLIRSLGAIPWPQGDALVDVLPNGNQPPGLLVRSAAGPVYIEGGQRISLRTATGVGLVRDLDGRAFLRELGDGGPVVTRWLEFPPPGAAP